MMLSNVEPGKLVLNDKGEVLCQDCFGCGRAAGHRCLTCFGKGYHSIEIAKYYALRGWSAYQKIIEQYGATDQRPS